MLISASAAKVLALWSQTELNLNPNSDTQQCDFGQITLSPLLQQGHTIPTAQGQEAQRRSGVQRAFHWEGKHPLIADLLQSSWGDNTHIEIMNRIYYTLKLFYVFTKVSFLSYQFFFVFGGSLHKNIYIQNCYTFLVNRSFQKYYLVSPNKIICLRTSLVCYYCRYTCSFA